MPLRQTRPVQLRTEVDNVPMHIGLAVPCGLILNELITNALIHAFPQGRTGEIFVSLKRGDDDDCLLSVADDGVGLRTDLVVEESPTLGLRLIRSLTRQVDGEFTLVRRPAGTEARLKVKVDP